MTKTYIEELKKGERKRGGYDWPYIANYSKRFDCPTSYFVSICHLYGSMLISEM